jgi:hypothetical protein
MNQKSKTRRRKRKQKGKTDPAQNKSLFFKKSKAFSVIKE